MSFAIHCGGNESRRRFRLCGTSRGVSCKEITGSWRQSRFDAMEKQFGELRERMAYLEGFLKGLREAITGRAQAS